MENNSVADNLAQIRSSIPEGVTLVAVSKFHPVERLREAYGAGQRIFGESRAQELLQKYPEMPKDVEWHFIGYLQKNKVRSLVPIVSLFHSVDSLELLECINRHAQNIDKVVNVLLELHVAQEQSKSGMTPKECLDIAESGALDTLTNVKVCGVMGMATNTDDQTLIRTEFHTIRQTFDTLKSKYFQNDSDFRYISMGMSDDRDIAIDEGSNMVRVGTAIFGLREY